MTGFSIRERYVIGSLLRELAGIRRQPCIKQRVNIGEDTFDRNEGDKDGADGRMYPEGYFHRLV